MPAAMTIQQVSERTGLSAYTLRYYERVHLIPAIERGGNGHRRCTEEDLSWIEFVKCLRSTGMPISEVQRYVRLEQQDDGAAAERLAIMESHRDRLRTRIEELSRFLERIDGKVERYREALGP